MSTERDRSALPHLYGAPAHRARAGAPEPERTLGPDDLPIENFRSPEDRVLATELFPRSYGGHAPNVAVPTMPMTVASSAPPQLRGRPVLLRAIAGRLIRPRN